MAELTIRPEEIRSFDGTESIEIDSETVDRVADTRPGSAETPEMLLLRQTLAPELQAAIDALPDAFRQAVWLRDVEEFSYAEIAAMLEIPLGTVMSRLHRARKLLRTELAAYANARGIGLGAARAVSS